MVVIDGLVESSIGPRRAFEMAGLQNGNAIIGRLARTAWNSMATLVQHCNGYFLERKLVGIDIFELMREVTNNDQNSS